MPRGVGAFWGRLVVAMGLCVALSNAAACSSSGHPKPSKSADALATAIADVMNSYTTLENVRAIIVNVNGRTRFEHYYSSSADESRSIFSVTKSVTSTLVGIAISEGRLRLDERLSQMLPRYAAEMKPTVARVTLRQLLTMTAGFTDTLNLTDDPMLTSPDWVRYILAHQDYAPGTDWHYSDHGAHLLAPILVQATGQSVLAYARAKLFDPLGIVTRPAAEPTFDPRAASPGYEKARFAWPIDPQHFHMTEALIKLRPRDMATFGQLFLQAGQWNGRPIVPAVWVAQATTAQTGKAFPDIGSSAGSAWNPTNYGYFWWIEPTTGVPAYYALGYGGQLVEVVPSLHLVIVVSCYVDPTNAHPPAEASDVQSLVDAIVPIVKTQPTR